MTMSRWFFLFFLATAVITDCSGSSNSAETVVVDRNNIQEQECSAAANGGSCVDAAAAAAAAVQDANNETTNIHGSSDADDTTCVDANDKCALWASQGKCNQSAKYMELYCQKSCGICNDNDRSTTEPIDMGVTQIIDADRAEQVKERIVAAHDYVVNVVAKNSTLSPLLDLCKLNHENCAFWAVLGECENNPGYMKTKCAPVCNSCDQLSIETRCPIDLETMPNVWEKGDVNAFFANLTTLPENQRYGVQVLSRPEYLPGDTPETADYLGNGPWAVLLENFITDDEADRLIELGAAEGYERSSDVGKLKKDGTYDNHIGYGRTSHNSWCQNVCYEDPIAQRVIQRITDLTNIPEENSENLQMLRYEEGEYYQTHHDYIPHQLHRQSGVRILTVYMYLNDLDEEQGGGTQFTNLKLPKSKKPLTVQPKKGAALLWPSVLDDDPHRKDERTMHQALPVKNGAVKYGANAWIHQRDFKTPNKNGCS